MFILFLESLAEFARHCFLIHLSLGVKWHISIRCFPYIRAPSEILCLDKSCRPQLDQTELTFFALQFKLICAEPSAQFTWYLIWGFLMSELLENTLNFLKFTSASNCFWEFLEDLFVCLFNAQLAAGNWIFQLSGGWWQMSPSRASLPAVAECGSQGQVSSFST